MIQNMQQSSIVVNINNQEKLEVLSCIKHSIIIQDQMLKQLEGNLGITGKKKIDQIN